MRRKLLLIILLSITINISYANISCSNLLIDNITRDFWTERAQEVEKTLSHFSQFINSLEAEGITGPKLLFFQELIQINFADASGIYELKALLDKKIEMSIKEWNLNNPSYLITEDEIIRPGVPIVNKQSNEVKYITLGATVPQGFEIMLPVKLQEVPLEVYSAQILYPSLAQGIFPVIFNNFFFVIHDLTAHSYAHTNHPLYAKLYRQLAKEVANFKYRNLDAAARERLFYFNEQLMVVNPKPKNARLHKSLQVKDITMSTQEAANILYRLTKNEVIQLAENIRDSEEDLILFLGGESAQITKRNPRVKKIVDHLDELTENKSLEREEQLKNGLITAIAEFKIYYTALSQLTLQEWKDSIFSKTAKHRTIFNAIFYPGEPFNILNVHVSNSLLEPRGYHFLFWAW